jgi:uncharacterized RDD family membrane protein YckC
MTDLPPPPPPAPPGYSPAPVTGGPALQLASKGRRFGGMLLEGLLVIVTLGIGWLIWSIIIWDKGQTPAKSILDMRVVKADEYAYLRRSDMALRELVGKVLLNFIPLYWLISAIFVLVDDRNQALWDKIAKSVVVSDPNNVFNL